MNCSKQSRCWMGLIGRLQDNTIGYKMEQTSCAMRRVCGTKQGPFQVLYKYSVFVKQRVSEHRCQRPNLLVWQLHLLRDPLWGPAADMCGLCGPNAAPGSYKIIRASLYWGSPSLITGGHIFKVWTRLEHFLFSPCICNEFWGENKVLISSHRLFKRCYFQLSEAPRMLTLAVCMKGMWNSWLEEKQMTRVVIFGCLFYLHMGCHYTQWCQDIFEIPEDTDANIFRLQNLISFESSSLETPWHYSVEPQPFPQYLHSLVSSCGARLFSFSKGRNHTHTGVRTQLSRHSSPAVHVGTTSFRGAKYMTSGEQVQSNFLLLTLMFCEKAVIAEEIKNVIGNSGSERKSEVLIWAIINITYKTEAFITGNLHHTVSHLCSPCSPQNSTRGQTGRIMHWIFTIIKAMTDENTDFTASHFT